MKIAIITGASAGLGEEFARRLKDYFPQVEKVWLIARRRDRLEALASKLQGLPSEVLPLDPVSYTHLDVYKRQSISSSRS